MKTLTTEQIELLKKPLPKEAVSKHPTKPYLSSIKAIYVVERLNDVFGIGKWKLKSTFIDAKEKMIIVQSFLSIDEYGIELESYGGNDNLDRGDAYKGATTDALTKICSMLHIGMDVFKGLSDVPQPKTPNVSLEDAIKEIGRCETLESVKNTWMKHKEFQENKFFIDEKEKMKIKLTIK